MNYKEKWQRVADQRASWKTVKNRARRMRKLRSAKAKRNFESAELMRANPTKAEAILYSTLTKSGIGFHPQVQVGPYIVDCLIVKKSVRTVIEVDGPYHDQQKSYDEERDAWFWSRYYRVIRFQNRDLESDPQAVLQKLENFMGEVTCRR